MAVYREFVCIVGGPLGLMPQNYFAQAGAKGSEVPKQAAQGRAQAGLGLAKKHDSAMKMKHVDAKRTTVQ